LISLTALGKSLKSLFILFLEIEDTILQTIEDTILQTIEDTILQTIED